MYSARTMPPELHEMALDAFGQNLRGALAQLTGDTLPERSWLLTQLGITHEGIGIRDPVRHAPAAYLASLSTTSALCGRIDAGSDPGDEHGGSRHESTMGRLRARVLDAATLPTGTGALKQKILSGMVDAAVLQQLLGEAKAFCSSSCSVAVLAQAILAQGSSHYCSKKISHSSHFLSHTPAHDVGRY